MVALAIHLGWDSDRVGYEYWLEHGILNRNHKPVHDRGRPKTGRAAVVFRRQRTAGILYHHLYHLRGLPGRICPEDRKGSDPLASMGTGG